MKEIAFLCSVRYLVSACASAYGADTIPTFAEKAQTAATALMQATGAISVQYAIMDSGKIVLSGGAGVHDKASKAPIQRDTMYAIGSISKMYATAAVMKLRDENKIDIDKSLTEYIPEFSMADRRYARITPRMLMNHSSGIQGSTFPRTILFGDTYAAPHDALLASLREQRLRAEPGEFSEYCNDGFTLLEILVERVSGMSYSEFITKSFSEPLRLANTKSPLDDFDRSKLAKLYLPQFENAVPHETVNIIGSGGLYATAEDIAKFSEVLMGDKPEILSRESALAMQNEEYRKGIWIEDNGENYYGYGLGWDHVHDWPFNEYGIKALAKGGDTLIFSHSSLIALPEHHISIAVCSSGSMSVFNYACTAKIVQEYLKEKGIIRDILPERTFAPPVKAEMPAALSAYSGTYANAGGHKEIVVKNGEIDMPPLVLGFVPAQKFVYTGENTFTGEDGSVTVTLVEMADGEKYAQVKMFVTLPGAGQFAYALLESQRIPPQIPSPKTAAAWRGKEGNKYYMINEKASSQFYLLPGVYATIRLNGDFSNGYAFGGSKIRDESTAVNTLKYFRDVPDIKLFTSNGAEYLQSKSFIYINEKNIPALPDAESTTCTIEPDGFARYYRIGEQMGGRRMTVKIPDGAAYIVYDENDACVNFTSASGNNATVLPANGKVAFIGKTGDGFEIRIDKSS